MNFTESFRKHLKESSQREDELVWELINYLYDKYGENFTIEDNVNGLTDRAEIYDSLAKQYMEENPEISFTEYVQNIIDDPHGLLVITSDLTESDNSMKDKFIEFKRQVHSDFEQFEEDMMNDDTDVFSGTEDSYANEMIWEHLSDTVYYLLEDKFDADRIYDLTNVFTSKLIDAYNENKLDDEIGRVFATYMHGLNESEKVPEKLTKDNKDTLEVGDILADNTNRYVVVDIINLPRSKSITVRDEKDWRPIYGDPISNWYGTKIIKGPFVRKEGKVIKEAEGSNSKAYVICYGNIEVWPTIQSAREFYEEGVAMSDGAEQQRYGNIAFALYKGANFADDEGPEKVTKMINRSENGEVIGEAKTAKPMTHDEVYEIFKAKSAPLNEADDFKDMVMELHGYVDYADPKKIAKDVKEALKNKTLGEYLKSKAAMDDDEIKTFKEKYAINESEEIPNDLKVETCVAEQTGGWVWVAYGKMADGRYYCLFAEGVSFFDDDIHKYEYEEDHWDETQGDFSDWEDEHRIKTDPNKYYTYWYTDPEYLIMLKQCIALDPNAEYIADEDELTQMGIDKLYEESEEDDYIDNNYKVDTTNLMLTNGGYHNNNDTIFGRVKLIPKNDKIVPGHYDIIYYPENDQLFAFKIGTDVRTIVDYLYTMDGTNNDEWIKLFGSRIQLKAIDNIMHENKEDLPYGQKESITAAISNAYFNEEPFPLTKVNYQ